MKVLKERCEKGYGLKLYLIEEEMQKKVKASKIEQTGKTLLEAPLDVHIAVTNQCNMQCEYCYAMDENFSKQKDMTLEEIKKVLDDLNKEKIFKISWSGGEPLIRNDFKDIVKYADRYGLVQSIITNGLEIDDEWIDIFKRYNIDIQLSLHKNEPEFWYKCMTLTQNSVKTYMDVVMEPELLGCVKDLVDNAKKAGIQKVKFGPLIPVGKAKIEVEEYRKILIKLLLEINSARCNDILLVTQFDRPKVNIESMTYLKREDLLCEGGRTLLYIDNNGDAYPCPLLKSYRYLYCGNILRNTLSEIWNGDVLNEYRESCEMAKGCDSNNCICGVWCRGLTLAYTGNIKEKTPFCKLWNEVQNERN
mgnify:FL=1